MTEPDIRVDQGDDRQRYQEESGPADSPRCPPLPARSPRLATVATCYRQGQGHGEGREYDGQGSPADGWKHVQPAVSLQDGHRGHEHEDR